MKVNIEEEMRDSYLDYAMSVIVSRALPDVRDGLKPVHRRVLYGMRGLGLAHTAGYKKSARIVGEVLGKYHPHGDTAVYDAMVRMTQDFSLRYPLLDGQGNFGSVDGDGAAAMRYTEARMERVAEEILADIDKETIEFVPNFDDTLTEPSVLPSRLPNLMVNGSTGIAVGMATNMPPHNLGEVTEALVRLVDEPGTEIFELRKIISGPDFPTGGIIYGDGGIGEAYLTGRGIIKIRARANVESVRGGREQIVVAELPYQVNKANLIEKIAALVRSKVLDGIHDIRDESDRDGIRVVIELKRDAVPQIVLNKLFKHTQLQDTFGIIMLALVDGVPKILNLKELLQHFIDFRHVVVVRRTTFELKAAEERAHILEGLKIALDNLDAVIKAIRGSKDPQIAKGTLVKHFSLSEKQATAILEMRLQRLTGLERRKIQDEYKEIIKAIAILEGILESKPQRMEIIKSELQEVAERYADERRTEIVSEAVDFSIEDMIAEEDMVITISHQGFIKRFPVSGFRRQGRGGRGMTGAGTHEDDFVEHLFVASTHHYILFFTDMGKCHWLKVHQIPEAGRASRGRSIANLIHKETEENVRAFITVRTFDTEDHVTMATERGLIKKTPLSAYKHPRKGGIYAIAIQEGDRLIEAKTTDGTHDIILGSLYGKAMRFAESEVRPTGRNTRGVRGMRLAGVDDRIVGMLVVKRSGTVLVVTESGQGKRSPVEDYTPHHRGGKGLITVKTSKKVGKMLAILEVTDSDDLMIITVNGVLIRQPVENIRVIGRNTQGVRLINLDKGDLVAAVARVVDQTDRSDQEPADVNGKNGKK